MHNPTLKTIPATRQAVAAFDGLNQQADIRPNEFADMENLSSQHYPLAATCRGSLVWAQNRPQGLLAKEQLCYVAQNRLHVGPAVYDLGLTAGEKRLVSMGAYILILPDKVYFNTADPGDFGPIAQVTESSHWRFSPCDQEGNPCAITYVGEPTPENPADGALWFDINRGQPCIRAYYAQGGYWVKKEGFVKLEMLEQNPLYPAGIFGSHFCAGDAMELEIQGPYLTDLQGQILPQDELLQALWDLTGTRRIAVLDSRTVVFPGLLPGEASISNTLRLTSRMPELDFVFECGNRLWGCRYGQQNDQFVNEIYASALGDFRRWNRYQGVSTDAYTASVGTDGPFTGAMNYLGSPLFFKENCLHRVYGSYPSEYRIQTLLCSGVAPGCADSLCLMGDTALYLGKNGVCAYDGATGAPISQKLKPLQGPGCAGVLGELYYLSVPAGLYVYDRRRRLWHLRSPIGAAQFCAYDGKLFYLDPARQAICLMDQGEESVPFRLTTGLICADVQQRIRAVCLRYSLKGQARVMVEYDSQGVQEMVGDLAPTGLNWAHMPLRPRRCDHFRLTIQGQGRFRLHSILQTLEKGSDLP